MYGRIAKQKGQKGGQKLKKHSSELLEAEIKEAIFKFDPLEKQLSSRIFMTRIARKHFLSASINIL
jgi:hypothetical protein